jgi:hypothetical protein
MTSRSSTAWAGSTVRNKTAAIINKKLDFIAFLSSFQHQPEAPGDSADY